MIQIPWQQDKKYPRKHVISYVEGLLDAWRICQNLAHIIDWLKLLG